MVSSKEQCKEIITISHSLAKEMTITITTNKKIRTTKIIPKIITTIMTRITTTTTTTINSNSSNQTLET